MAISTTTDFNPDVGDLVEEAFELLGQESRTGNDIRTARRSLNYLLLEWANKGINLWTVDEQKITSSTIVAGTATYDIDIDTISILDAVIRIEDGDTDLQSDIVINRISETTYSQIPQKLQTGRPVQFYYNRIGVKDITSSTDRNSTVTLWPVPDTSNKYTFVYWRMRRIQDAGGSAANTMEIPDRFLPAMLYGLASKLAIKKAADRFVLLNSQYLEMFKDAAEEDRSKEDYRIVPNMDSYS